MPALFAQSLARLSIMQNQQKPTDYLSCDDHCHGSLAHRSTTSFELRCQLARRLCQPKLRRALIPRCRSCEYVKVRGPKLLRVLHGLVFLKAQKLLQLQHSSDFDRLQKRSVPDHQSHRCAAWANHQRCINLQPSYAIVCIQFHRLASHDLRPKQSHLTSNMT